jgi:hypothetical protein
MNGSYVLKAAVHFQSSNYRFTPKAEVNLRILNGS